MNKIEPKILSIEKKHCVGTSLNMSLVNNQTAALWKSFGPNIAKIEDKKSQDKISLQVYPEHYFRTFNPAAEFQKWALVEVESGHEPMDSMQGFIIPGGDYAVFHYKGSSDDKSIFQYIYSEWIPNSKFTLDNRPHFEILGQNYRNGDPESEEEIWIPVMLQENKNENLK